MKGEGQEEGGGREDGEVKGRIDILPQTKEKVLTRHHGPKRDQVSKFTDLLIHKLSFVQWVCEIAQKHRGNLYFQATALLSLQEAVEAYVVSLFKNASLCATHAKQVMIVPKDIQLAQRILDDAVKNT